MHKVWLIIQREFLNRVQKKSFLITTILVPLIFPAIIGGLVYFMIKEAEGAKADVVELVDESGKFGLENTRRFEFIPVPAGVEQAKKVFQESNHFALLYIPATDANDPKGIVLYTKESQSIEKIGSLTQILNDRVKDFKMERYNIDKETLKDIRTTDVNIKQVNLSLWEY